MATTRQEVYTRLPLLEPLRASFFLLCVAETWSCFAISDLGFRRSRSVGMTLRMLQAKIRVPIHSYSHGRGANFLPQSE